MKTNIQQSTFLILAVLVTGLIGCSGDQDKPPQKEKSEMQIDTALRYEGGLFYQGNEEDPFTGLVKWRYDSGTLAARLYYEEGYLISRDRYFRDGQVMSELDKEGDILVTSASWYPSGQIKSEYDRGFVKQWYENGQIQAVWNTDTTGILNGKATAWYPDGSLLGIEHYKNGKLHGKRILYDKSGNVKASGYYSDGERQKIN